MVSLNPATNSGLTSTHHTIEQCYPSITICLPTFDVFFEFNALFYVQKLKK